MNQDELASLLKKYANDECTAEEKKTLEKWLDHKNKTERWEWEDEAHRIETGAKIKERLFAEHFPRKSNYAIWKIASAAAVLLFCNTFIFLNKKDKDSVVIQAKKQQEQLISAVLPGTKAAQLTLSNGSMITLNDANDGILSIENNAIIKKLDEGKLSYEESYEQYFGKESFNTITIPKGGQYQVKLSDGTKVWLNSASSITYPTHFKGNERKITLTGEAYFEVAKNTKKPFKIKAGDLEVIVTGTHFNINAHKNNDKITTTLLEGGVNVVRNNKTISLQPGQQAISIKNKDEIQRINVNPANSIAWMNGYFVFNDQDIASIMKDISRWYDVDIEYKTEEIPQRKVGGTFSRSKSMLELLEYLESIINIKFKVEGRRVIVMS